MNVVQASNQDGLEAHPTTQDGLEAHPTTQTIIAKLLQHLNCLSISN
ncbi:hypothetical protein QUB68_08870 [Microcoleus sp. A006_D1]